MCSPQLKSQFAAPSGAQSVQLPSAAGDVLPAGIGGMRSRPALMVVPLGSLSRQVPAMMRGEGMSATRPIVPPVNTTLRPANFIAGAGDGSGSIQGTPATADELSRAQSIYGETASLYPQPKIAGGSIYDRKSWQDRSWSDLWDARALIGVISRRNNSTRRDDQSHNTNPLVQQQWNQAVWPAQSSSDLPVPANVQFFYLRDGAVAPRPSPSFPGKLYVRTSVYKSYGPFVNNGGGSFGHSNKVYIDFYQNDGPASRQK